MPFTCECDRCREDIAHGIVYCSSCYDKLEELSNKLERERDEAEYKLEKAEEMIEALEQQIKHSKGDKNVR